MNQKIRWLKILENVWIKHLNDSKAFIEYWQRVDDVYNNIGDYNPSREGKVLIVFDDIVIAIADIMTNKKFQAIIKELFTRCRKLNISLVFVSQSCFSVPKKVRLNSTHYLIIRFTTKESYKILLLIIQQTLITKILWDL